MIKSLTNYVVAGAVATLLLAATPAWAEDAAIKIGNFTFGPQELKVKAGTTVTWSNEDDIPHTVVSPKISGRKRLIARTSTHSHSPRRVPTSTFVPCTRI